MEKDDMQIRTLDRQRLCSAAWKQRGCYNAFDSIRYIYLESYLVVIQVHNILDFNSNPFNINTRQFRPWVLLDPVYDPPERSQHDNTH